MEQRWPPWDRVKSAHRASSGQWSEAGKWEDLLSWSPTPYPLSNPGWPSLEVTWSNRLFHK